MKIVYWLRRLPGEVVHQIRYGFDKAYAERIDMAWLEGREEADQEVDEVTLEKDVFIEQQAWVITECMAVIDKTGSWSQVPDDLYEALRSYV